MGGVSIRRAPSTAMVIHDDTSSAPTPKPAKKPWTRRSPRFVPTLLPASFYQERAKRRDAINSAYRARYRKQRGKIRKQAHQSRERLYADPKRHEAQKARWRDNAKRYAEANRVKKKDQEQLRAKGRRKYQRIKAQELARANPTEVRKLIRVHVPGYLMSAAQMDVINSVMVQILDRKVPFNEIAAWVKKSVTEYNRQFDHFKNVSIDAPIAGTDGLTRADLIDSEAFHF